MQLKEQNKQILAYLEKQSQTVVTTVNSLPRDFPVDLPLNDFGNIQVVENYLEDIDNFTKLVRASHLICIYIFLNYALFLRCPIYLHWAVKM